MSETSPAWRLRLIWVARLYARACIVAVGIVLLIFTLRSIGFEDIDAYWNAAMRLRAGEPLYPPLADPANAQYYADTYTYSPWFAFAWVPLTLLPRPVASVLWEAILLGAAGYLAWRLVQQRAWLAIAFFGPLLLDTVSEGNVQALLVAAVAWGVDRRSGPLWVAVAASLKAFPLLLAIVYVRRGEWRRAGLTLSLTALLVTPTLLFDLSDYPLSTGRSLLWGTPFYLPVILAAYVWASRFTPLAYGRLSAAAAVVLTSPRFWLYDATWLLVGVPHDGRRDEHSVVGMPQRTPAESARHDLAYGVLRT